MSTVFSRKELEGGERKMEQPRKGINYDFLSSPIFLIISSKSWLIIVNHHSYIRLIILNYHSYIMIDLTRIRVSEIQVLEIQITPHMVNKHHKIEVRLYHENAIQDSMSNWWYCTSKDSMPTWPHFPPKYFASNCTYTTSKYCIPNLSNFTFQDSNWPYFTFEDCFIDHVKHLKILCLFSHTLNQKILCLTGRIFHPKIPCLVGHILQRFYVLLGIFHI